MKVMLWVKWEKAYDLHCPRPSSDLETLSGTWTAQSTAGKLLSWSRPSESQRSTQTQGNGAEPCFLDLGV